MCLQSVPEDADIPSTPLHTRRTVSMPNPFISLQCNSNAMQATPFHRPYLFLLPSLLNTHLRPNRSLIPRPNTLNNIPPTLRPQLPPLPHLLPTHNLLVTHQIHLHQFLYSQQ